MSRAWKTHTADKPAASATKKTPAAKPAPKQEPLQYENSVDDVVKSKAHWFDDASSGFFRQDPDRGWIRYNESQFKRYLKCEDYRSSALKHEFASQTEVIMTRLQHERRVDFAGNVAGYPAGIHTICGYTILIPKGPVLPAARRGPWNTLKGFFGDLLKRAARYLYAWLKAAVVSVRNGFPWRPGQLLAVAGPAGCGKSLLQNLITEILGGRSCKPYGYLTGQTAFNSNYFGAEHWMIEDEASSTDMRIRRTFGAMLKNVIVNAVQNFHAKGRDALSVTPYVRMTMSLNDNPESLLVMPPLDEDITDKVILLRGLATDTPFVSSDVKSRSRFWATLIGEIPAFLYALDRWEVPKEIRDARYGVAAYQNADLLSSVHALSNEARLLQIIDTCGFWKEHPMGWQGNALELEQKLMELDKQSIVSRLLTFHTACGMFLSRLCRSAKERVRRIENKGRVSIYEVIPRK